MRVRQQFRGRRPMPARPRAGRLGGARAEHGAVRIGRIDATVLYPYRRVGIPEGNIDNTISRLLVAASGAACPLVDLSSFIVNQQSRIIVHPSVHMYRSRNSYSCAGSYSIRIQ